MQLNEEIENSLLSSLVRFLPKLTVERNAYKLVSTFETKCVEVIWPHPLKEVFFDFLDSGEKIYSDSIEFSEDERAIDISEYLVKVIENFLLHETRLDEVGVVFKSRELKFSNDRGWQSIF
jgi:hypothetical protein